MKRILIRMSALVTVVVLGLIAIAQAQRSADHSTAVAANASTTSETNQAERHEPIRLSDSDAPRPLTLPSRVNPLRSETSAAGQTPSQWAGRPYAQEPGESSTAVQPLVMSGNDSTTLIATAGSDATFDANPTGPAPGGVPAASGFFPLRPAMAAPTAASQEQPGDAVAETGPSTDAVLAPASVPALAPTSVQASQSPLVPNVSQSRVPFPASTPGEPAPLRTDPFSRSMGSSQPAVPSTPTPITESVPALPPSSPLRDANNLGQLAPNEPDRFSTVDTSPLSHGTGTPGSKQLEGAQSPQVTIEKTAPADVQVGKPATFRIRVRNSGKVAAHNVEIHDELPRGTRLMSTNPQATQGVRGELIWSLGTMPPGEEMTAEIQVMPVEEGELGSVATVRFHAEATARTLATKPELIVETTAPSQVLVGEPVVLTVTVTNPGTGVASGVVLEERIPAGLQHPAGTELEYDIGELKPKESRQLQLQMVAQRPGLVTNVLIARGEVNLKAEHRLDIQVLAPQLDLAVEGPRRRFLEREAAYTVAITNPGTAPAERVELVAQLPSGLKFVSANNSGHYNEANHTVHWQLDELPIRETGSVKLVTLPVEAGEHKLLVSANADKGVSAEREQPVLIEGIAAIMFEVVDVNDPVEKGGETTYEIRVVNQGSKAASNVQLVVNLPAGMRPIAAEGPTHHSLAANRIVFDALSRLAPKADTTYRVRVQCLQPGDQRIQAQLMTAEMREPVTKEESTRVYSDE